MQKFGLSTLTILMLSGCATLGPDFNGIKNPPLPKNWSKHAKKDASAVQWWKTFHAPELNRLVKQAYAQNLDIQSDGLRIAQSRAALGISQGLAFPQVQSVSGQATSTRTGLGDLPPPA